MKQTMQRLSCLLLVLFLLCGMIPAALAQDGGWEYRVLADGTAEITGFSGSAVSVRIPSVLDGKKVTAIGDWAFCDRVSLKSILIPSSVTAIGRNAFSGCTGLSSIVLPKSIVEIGDWAFAGCTALRAITIPTGTAVIGDGAFYGCSSLTAVSIAGTVTAIGGEAFAYCTGLTSITLPNSVSQLGANPFRGDSAAIQVSARHPYLAVIDGVLFEKESWRLVSYPCSKEDTSYRIPTGTTVIGAGAFHGSCLQHVEIPDSVTAIEDGAFAWCSALKQITIPLSVTDMGTNPFLGSPAAPQVADSHPYLAVIDGVLFAKQSRRLIAYPGSRQEASYTIPQGIRQIGSGAFAWCSALTAVTIPDSVTEVDAHAFVGCSGLTSIAIPSGVTAIGDEAFAGCGKLMAVSLSGSVQTIGDSAFAGCAQLRSVTVPYGVVSLGDRAFADCRRLRTFSLPQTVTIIGIDLFGETIPGQITAPAGSFAAQYCSENGISYTIADPSDWLQGG